MAFSHWGGGGKGNLNSTIFRRFKSWDCSPWIDVKGSM